MSDAIDVSAGLAPLPVDWYCSREVADLEKRLIFDSGPGYVGHELMVPNIGDFHTLDWMDNARLLLRNEVTRDDVAEAITLTKNMLYTVAVDRKTGKIDMGTITGVPASERSKLEIVFQKYKELAGPTNEPVELNALVKAIVETGKFNEVEAKILFSQLEQKGVFYMVKPGYYRRA